MDKVLRIKKLFETVYIGLGNYVDDETFVSVEITQGNKATRVTFDVDQWKEIVEFVKDQVIIEHEEEAA